MEKSLIRRAAAEDAPVLTALSFASKGHWGYPQSYFTIWHKELTINAEYIGDHDVFLLEQDSMVCGYYSLVELEENVNIGNIILTAGTWLEHMFVQPRRIGTSIGSQLFKHMRGQIELKGVAEVHILADPHARDFYQKMGCQYRGEYPSSIAGRTTPYLVYQPGI